MQKPLLQRGFWKQGSHRIISQERKNQNISVLLTGEVVIQGINMADFSCHLFIDTS
jgi:hypothetical protein